MERSTAPQPNAMVISGQLSCGTGACAAVVAGISNGWLQTPVIVHTRGGDLTIEWAGEDHAVIMRGPATTVFEGELEL